jgi:phage recombination protein Bet
MQLITNVIAKGATQDELNLFLYRCENLGLDPLKPGQIYFIKYGNNPGTIVIGIEGFRSRASKTGKLAGIKRGAIRNQKGELTGAFAEVYRSDWKECAREEVPLSEYNTSKGNWTKMPETMIKKVAEAAALRMAFPDDLGGIYTKEEMDQAEIGVPRVFPDQPGPDDGIQDDPNYRLTFGKWNRRTLEELYSDPRVGPNGIESYIRYLEDSQEKTGKSLSAVAIEFINRASEFLGVMENRAVEQLREPGSDG